MPQADPYDDIPKKSAKTTLSVRIGTARIENPKAATVFCDTLQRMGLDRVSRLGLSVSGLPLVSQNAPARKRSYRELDGWFVITHSSTRDKKATLEQAAEFLGIPIDVRIALWSDMRLNWLLD